MRLRNNASNMCTFHHILTFKFVSSQQLKPVIVLLTVVYKNNVLLAYAMYCLSEIAIAAHLVLGEVESYKPLVHHQSSISSRPSC